MRVSPGSNAERLSTEFEPLGGSYPQVLPGGKAVLVSSGTDAVLFSLETREKKVLVKNVRYSRYVPTGHLVYIQAGAIEAVPFDLATLKKTGPFDLLR